MLKIVVGNKNYSSWSLRPWLALKRTGAPFEETVVALDQPDTAEQIRKYSPAGRVPVLIDGDLTVWDSLAICEYLAEKFPDRELWPKDARERARARSIAAEMHSGFAALRNEWPMKFREQFPYRQPSPETQADVARITAIWDECVKRSGGPYLFGRTFGIADAFYAPVVSRFRTYGLTLHGNARAYADAIWATTMMQEWLAAAQTESLRLPKYEK